MELVAIFTVNNGEIAPAIYAIKYKGEVKNEWRRLFDQWQEVDWLRVFFKKQQHLLNGDYYKGITVDAAISKTIDDAGRLEDRILELFDNAAENELPDLEDKFKTLHKSEYAFELTKHKAYGEVRNSWLRIYAVRIDANVYVITGGAIKLTPTMDGGEETKEELVKLSRAVQFLKAGGYISADNIADYFELD